jgi:hypothetical protein
MEYGIAMAMALFTDLLSFNMTNFLQATAARDTAASSPQPPTTPTRVLRTTALPLLLLLM